MTNFFIKFQQAMKLFSLCFSVLMLGACGMDAFESESMAYRLQSEPHYVWGLSEYRHCDIPFITGDSREIMENSCSEWLETAPFEYEFNFNYDYVDEFEYGPHFRENFSYTVYFISSFYYRQHFYILYDIGDNARIEFNYTQNEVSYFWDYQVKQYR